MAQEPADWVPLVTDVRATQKGKTQTTFYKVRKVALSTLTVKIDPDEVKTRIAARRRDPNARVGYQPPIVNGRLVV